MSTDTALIVIDAQVGVVGAAYHHEEVLNTIKQLLGRARSSGTPVIYVQHNEPQGFPLATGTAQWAIHPTITPQAGEPIIPKTAPDAFYETHLQDELEARGIKRLIITGGQTEVCVDTTIRRAVAQGYDVLLVSDAHTTEDNSILPAEKIIAFYNEILNGFWAGEHVVRVRPAQEIQLAETEI